MVEISTRREFLQSITTTGAMAGIASAGENAVVAAETGDSQQPLPRHVWIASLSLAQMETGTPDQLLQQVWRALDEVRPYRPDIVCLPETFPFAGARPNVADVAEEPLGPISRPFAMFARENRCYLICPIYTRENGRYYNAAIVFDRNGQVLGEYRKMRPTSYEMEYGISPGPPDPPVFRTDFGLIGVQICFDIEWPDGWRKLRAAGAEIIFWPSAFAGGQMINTVAWQNKVVVVSSTHKDTTKICDITGEVLASTDRWSPRWTGTAVNLDKVFLHTYPFNEHFPAIRAKYGRSVSITTFDEEEWSIIESRDRNVRIADIMRDFNLQSHEEYMQAAERRHRAFASRADPES